MDYIETCLQKDTEWSIYKYNKDIDEEKIPSEIKAAIEYLRQYANFSYSSNLCQENPFRQFYAFVNGAESIKPSDLNNGHAEHFIKILPLTNHPFIKAKLYDLLGIITKDISYKKLAADNYKLFLKDSLLTAEHNHILYIALERAIYLYNISNRISEKEFIDEIFHSLAYKNTEQNFNCKYYATLSMDKVKSKCLASFIQDIEGLVASYDKTYAIVCLDLLDVLLKYYSSIHSENKYEQTVDKYVLYCKNICKDLSPYGYHYIDRALKLITTDKLKDKYEDTINELLFLKDEEQKKVYEKINFVEHTLDSGIVSDIENKKNEITQIIKSFENGAQQLIYLISNFLPITKKELASRLELQKNSLLDIVNEILYNDDGTIKYESAYATKEETKQVKISKILLLDLKVKTYILLLPFIVNTKIDENLKSVLASISENNLFIPTERKSIINKIILDGVNNNIRKALYDLIPQFEYGLTNYLKSNGLYPIMYRGSNKVLVDLNHILTSNKSKNKYRDQIVSIIGENLTLELEYLLCNKYFGNLRNINYHSGYRELDQCSIYEAAAFYFILEAYCLGCE